MKTRRNESTPSRMVRQTGRAIFATFFGLAFVAGLVAAYVFGGPLVGLSVAIVAANVVALVTCRDFLGA